MLFTYCHHMESGFCHLLELSTAAAVFVSVTSCLTRPLLEILRLRYEGKLTNPAAAAEKPSKLQFFFILESYSCNTVVSHYYDV